MEEQKIIQFERSVETYLNLAEDHLEKGDYERALGFLFSALKIENSPEIIMAIAEVYGEMGAFELSNKYWFYYLDKEGSSLAYEELAINFFYMEDYVASSYYFHLKLTTDGFVNRDKLDPEIIEFFSGEEHRKNSYYVAYPYDKADYSYTAKRGKRALASGALDEAISVLSSIPVQCMDEDAFGDLALAYIMNDDSDKASDVARTSLANHGDNVTAFCNLSTVYDMKEDFEKSEYYYQKALSCRKGEETEAYKLATCAIEREDHLTVKTCLEKILQDRPNDLIMRFFYGISLLNLRDYNGAYEQLSKVFRIVPFDGVYKYYARLSLALKDGNKVKDLPNKFRYIKLFPEEVEKKMDERLTELLKNPVKAEASLKKPETRELLINALKIPDLARKSVYVLSTTTSSHCKKILKSALIDSEVETGIKRVILYSMAINGVREKISVVDRINYFKCKPKKVACESDQEGGLYLSAYALCFSRISFITPDQTDKLATATNAVYKKLKGKVGEAEANNEEIGALILSVADIKDLSEFKTVKRFFDIKKEKFDLLLSIYKGENK